MTQPFETGMNASIDNVIAAYKDTLRLTPDGHTDKPTYLSNLGRSFLDRFGHFGDVEDVDNAIAAYGDAVLITLNGHKSDHLSNLWNAFMRRLERFGDVADVNNAIAAHKEAVQLTPDGHIGKPGYLNTLGTSYLDRFECLGDVEDIDKAISAHNDAVQLTPNGNAGKPACLSDLGSSYTRRFKRLWDMADIDKAIVAHKNAVQLTLDGHVNKPVHLNNLGNSLLDRPEQLGNKVGDIDWAIAAHKDAVQLTPDGHAGKPRHLNNLGNSYLRRFEQLDDVASLDEATQQFSHSARSFTGPPIDRFRASVKWAYCNVRTGVSSMDAYSCAFNLLPHVDWVGLPMADRHKELAEIDDVVRNAAAAAIHLQQYDTALEWLEQGRSIVLGKLLNLRSPVKELNAEDPALADRLKQISNELKHAGTQDISDNPSQWRKQSRTIVDWLWIMKSWWSASELFQDLKTFCDRRDCRSSGVLLDLALWSLSISTSNNVTH